MIDLFESGFEHYLVKLVTNYLELILLVALSAQKLISTHTLWIKYALCHTEIRKEFLLLDLQSKLSLAKYEEKFVILQHCAFGIFPHVENFLER